MTYNYIALNTKGEQENGTTDADSESKAIQILRTKGLYPTRISQDDFEEDVEDISSNPLTGLIEGIAKYMKGETISTAMEQTTEDEPKTFFRKLVKRKEESRDRKRAWSTLGTLVTSGVPILQALNITRDSCVLNTHKTLFQEVHEAVKNGESIVSPLKNKIPFEELALIDIGEETGQLPEMLNAMAGTSTPNIPEEDIQFHFLNRIAILIDSGLPLLRCLNTLSRSTKTEQPEFSKLCDRLGDGVQSGHTFSECIARESSYFEQFTVNMVKAGELGGVLEITLQRCADEILKDYQERNLI